MVPCRIQFGEHGYLDKVSITIDEFYEELETSPHHPTTSQPAPGDFRRQFQFLASHFDDVISINLTSAASGTFQAAELAAARTDAPGKIHVIDSLNASHGQGQLAVLAAECAEAGIDVKATLAAVRAQVSEIRTFAIPDLCDPQRLTLCRARWSITALGKDRCRFFATDPDYLHNTKRQGKPE
jgi:DegV family protein with EDD domain